MEVSSHIYSTALVALPMGEDMQVTFREEGGWSPEPVTRNWRGASCLCQQFIPFSQLSSPWPGHQTYSTLIAIEFYKKFYTLVK